MANDTVPVVTRMLALIGGGLLIASLFVPLAPYFKIADRNGGVEWLPVPLGSAALGIFLALLLHHRRVVGSALAAVGAESALFFVSLLLIVRQEPRAGVFLGLVGGVVIFAGGLIALTQPVTAPAPLGVGYQPQHQAPPAVAPSGWYPDPAGQARERFWDGAKWTDATRG